MHEKSLLSTDFEGVVSFLTHLPDSLSGSELFRHIEPFMRSYPVNSETARSKKRFFQVRKRVWTTVSTNSNEIVKRTRDAVKVNQRKTLETPSSSLNIC